MSAAAVGRLAVTVAEGHISKIFEKSTAKAIESIEGVFRNRGEIDASQRATARMLGVDETTTRRDLGSKPAANAAVRTKDDQKPEQNEAVESVVAANAAPTWFQADADPTKAAKRDAMVGVETIGAVVEAYDKGEIELEAVDPEHPGGTVCTLPGGKVYSLATVARFLGWIKPSDGQAARDPATRET